MGIGKTPKNYMNINGIAFSLLEIFNQQVTVCNIKRTACI